MIPENKLIADFMGVKTYSESWVDYPDGYIHENALRYHSSWDKLMPVVEKIRTLSDNISDKENGLAYSTITIGIEANGHALGLTDTKYRSWLLGTLVYQRMINSFQHTFDQVSVPHFTEYQSDGLVALYKIVVRFIQWYNNQKPELGGNQLEKHICAG